MGRRAPEKRAVWRWKTALEQMGFHVTLTSQPHRALMTKGIPDMYLRHTRWGLRLWVEAKAGRRKATDSQRAWGEMERESGGHWIVAHSLDEILAKLVEMGAPIEAPALD